MYNRNQQIIDAAEKVKNEHNEVLLSLIVDKTGYTYSQVLSCIKKMKKENLWPYKKFHVKITGNKNAVISDEAFLTKYEKMFEAAERLADHQNCVKLEDLAKEVGESYNKILYFVRVARKRNLWHYNKYKPEYKVNKDSLWQKTYELYKQNPKIKASHVINKLNLEKCKNFSICCYLYRMRRGERIGG